MTDPRITTRLVKDAVVDGPPTVAFTIQGQADGAIPNGTRVRKHVEDRGGEGSVPLGGEGIVTASVAIPEDMKDDPKFEVQEGEHFAYFIVWDAFPGLPVFTRGYKVEPVQP